MLTYVFCVTIFISSSIIVFNDFAAYFRRCLMRQIYAIIIIRYSLIIKYCENKTCNCLGNLQPIKK